jgi:hypothetical protein
MEDSSKLIIHIGLHKTGTTFLQYTYFKSLKDTLYMHGNSFFVPWKEQMDKDNKNMLLSYEGFSGVAWNNKYNWIDSFEINIEALQRFFPDAIILVVFRKHGDLALSMYKQYINEGKSCKLNEFYGDNAVISAKDLNFERRINFLEERFNHVYLLNFEIFKIKGFSYFDNLFSKEFNLKRIAIEENSKKSNKSLSGSKLDLLRKINPVYNRLPTKLRKTFRYARISPRDVLQNKLSFWNPKDSQDFQDFKDKLNKEFAQDWKYFESKQWKG